MLSRVIVSLIGAPLLFLALFWPGGVPFTLMAVFIGVVGVMEVAAALESETCSIELIWPLQGVVLLIVSGIPALGEKIRLPGLLFLFMAALTRETFGSEPRPFEKLSPLMLATAYPGLMAVSVALRWIPGKITLGSLLTVDTGAFWVAVSFLLVWATDIGAYGFGKIWGRRKLVPHLSPSKTWEGALGGYCCAALTGSLLAAASGPIAFPGGFASGLLLGSLAGVLAQVGDVVESAMKRELGAKDFGGWLPGHGGVMDRFDSFLYVCPLVYAWVHWTGFIV